MDKIEAAQKGRIEYIDVLRVLSALSVVFLHTAAGSLRGNTGSVVWHTANVLTGIMSISVPIFFMISGAMVMSSKKTLSIAYTYKKRVVRMAVPFLVWSLFAVIYYQAVNLYTTGAVNWWEAAKKLAYMPGQAVTVHLWFMYALIPLYLLSPILKRLVDAMNESLGRYMFVLWIVFSSVLPTIASFLPVKYQTMFQLSPDFNMNFMNGYLGYFLIGYYLFIYDKKISKKLLTGVIIIDTAVISLGTWWKTVETDSYSEVFKTYPRLFILILSIAVFMYIKSLMEERHLPPLGSGILQVLSMTSFGIYLMHNLIVDFVSSFMTNLWPADSVFVLFFWYTVILLASLGLTIMLSSWKLTCFIFTGMSYKEACQTCNIQYFFDKYLAQKIMPDSQERNIHQ